MKTMLVVLSVSLAVVCVVGSAGLIGGFVANRDLREANQKLQADLEAAQLKSEGLASDNQALSARLEQLQSLTQELKTRMDEMETSKPDAELETPSAPAPFLVPAYLGQKWLGQAWFVARNPRKDPNTQRYVYEPVILLDESLRAGFVTHHTNVVEREVERQTYNSIAYYPQPVYYWSYPHYSRPGTNRWPPRPVPQTAPPSPPPTAAPFGGAVAAQKPALPASQIKTRSQQLGIPAQSIKLIQKPDNSLIP